MPALALLAMAPEMTEVSRAQLSVVRPNVLVIVTDDQRDGTLGVMPKTRRWLVAGGRNFVNAFVSTPLCCPSRASILTGRYAHNHGVTNNGRADQLDHSLTVQRYLHDAGYFTALAGKFLNGWDVQSNPPYFDRWAMQRRGYYDSEFNIDGEVRVVPDYSVNFIGTQAMSFIEGFEADDARPWFLYVTPFAPHPPATPPPEYAEAETPPWNTNPAVRERNRSDKPGWVREHSVNLGQIGMQRERQLRTLMAVDDLVDRLVRELARNREGSRTLVIFLSDNGFLWGEHGLGEKRHPYTPSVEVPLLLRWRGQLSPGTKDRRLAVNVDVAPTILDAANVRPAVAMDGRSLLRSSDRSRVLLESWKDIDARWIQPWSSIRTTGYQYIEHYDGSDRSTPVFREYYSLGDDPWQLSNLLHDRNSANDPKVGRLHRILMRASRCSGSECP